MTRQELIDYTYIRGYLIVESDFRCIGRAFSTENDRRFETIGAFWDGMPAKYREFKKFRRRET